MSGKSKYSILPTGPMPGNLGTNNNLYPFDFSMLQTATSDES
jgi:hypothetical protein